MRIYRFLALALVFLAPAIYAQQINIPNASGSASGGTGSISTPAGPVIGWYLGPNCPATNTGQCVNSPANVQIDNTASWTTSNGIVAITDSRFTAADVGKIAWGYSSSSGLAGSAGCNPYQPAPIAAFITATHLTISSFTDANHVVLSGTPSNASVNSTSCFIWGSPDDAGASSLWTLVNAATSCPRVTLQAGNYLFTTPPQILWGQPTACANLPSTFPNGTLNTGFGNMMFSMGYEVEGRGNGPTMIVLPPDFPESGSCNNGYKVYLAVAGGLSTYTGSCFAVPPEGHFHDFSIFSGNGGLPANAAMLNVGVGTLENVTCIMAGATVNTNIGLVMSVQSQVQQVNLESCGATGAWVDSSTGTGTIYSGPSAMAYRLSIDNSRSVSGNNQHNIQIQAGANWSCHSCKTFGSQDSAGLGISQIVNHGGTVWLEDVDMWQFASGLPVTAYASDAAGSILHASHVRFGTTGSGTPSTVINGIQCITAACTNYLQDSLVNSAGAGVSITDGFAGSNTYDLGGTTIVGAPTLTGKYHHRETGTCTFAASTTCAVTFTTSFGSTAPTFLVAPNIVGAATTLTVSALSATGATITASASNSSAVNWEAVMQ